MDKALKQRLVGASVLIILAVIVLPMILSGRSDTLQQESRQIELPVKPEELSVETRRFPVGIPNRPTASEEADEDESTATSGIRLESPAGPDTIDEKKPVTIGKTDAENTEVVREIEPADTATAVEKPPTVTTITLSSGKSPDVLESQAEDDAAEGPRYLVQVASFSSEKNANALASRLRAAQLPVLMDVVERIGGPLHRVRVGPYTERVDADTVVSGLRAQMKDISPRVLDLRPGESAPVSTPSDPLIRWVVQVGSFNSAESADALVTKLRLSGLTAFSEQVTSAGNTAYKVRIGPEIDRDKASALPRKVKADHNLDGFVPTQE